MTSWKQFLVTVGFESRKAKELALRIKFGLTTTFGYNKKENKDVFTIEFFLSNYSSNMWMIIFTKEFNFTLLESGPIIKQLNRIRLKIYKAKKIKRNVNKTIKKIKRDNKDKKRVCVSVSVCLLVNLCACQLNLQNV